MEKNVLHRYSGHGEVGYNYYCPGCQMFHGFMTENPKGRPVWIFDGNLESPTISPSILTRFPWGKDKKEEICHCFVKNGKIQFLGDCTHNLAGQTVDMAPDPWNNESLVFRD